MPKVSVIVPVYNVEQFIERCVRSLFEQTLDDLEYIFINDCTPDKSIEVLASPLEDYPSRKEQVKIIEMPVNSGQAKVRKIGIEAATGDYIIHCDSDDWVDVTIYEKMWKKATEEHLDMVVCGYVITDGTKIISTHYNEFKGFKSLQHGIIADEVKSYSCTKLIKRDYFKHVKIWPKCNFMEDVAIITPITFQCKFIGKIDEPLYFYFYNSSGITNGSNAKEKAIQIKANTNLAIANIEFLGDSKEFKYELKHRKCIAKLYCWDISWLSYIRLFPEINIGLLFDPLIPFEKKLGHLSKCFGIHGISKLRLFRKKSFLYEKQQIKDTSIN